MLILYIVIIFFVSILLNAFFEYKEKIIKKSKELTEKILKICKNTLESTIDLIEFLSTDLFSSVVFLLKGQPDNDEQINNKDTLKEENKSTEKR